VGPALETLPAWVAYDRKVLRFGAYFKEAVTEDPVENFRIRKCLIYLYLEDDSIHVAEPKQQNSGIPQGVFLKRHRIPKEHTNGEYFGMADLNIGAQVTFYARTFFVVSCDPFTRQFLSNSGMEVGEEMGYPDDPIDMFRTSRKSTKALAPPNPRSDDLARYSEAKLGKATNAINTDKLKQFMENDRKVLRFFALWDDRASLCGDRRPFVINFYLADDTVEVLEVNGPNCGRDPFPVFCKRGPLPNRPIEVDALGPTKTYTTYTVESFKIGQYVSIFGRPMYIHDCDAFTREYCIKSLGYTTEECAKVNVQEPEVPLPVNPIPPWNGYGSLRDSEQNCTMLIPKAAKRDLAKMMANNRKILRYTGKMKELPGRPLTNADLDRVFVVQYFLADDTVMIFEPPIRNSGIIGGKFLERMEVYREGTTELLQPQDFFVGANLMIYCRCFELLEADDYTYNFMEEVPNVWPMSSFERVVKHMEAVCTGMEESVRSAFVEVDAEGTGYVDAPQLHTALMTAGINIGPQEVITIIRKLSDASGDGKVSVELFFQEVFGAAFS